MSDTVSILLFCLMLLVPVALIVGLAMFIGKKSNAKGRGRSNESATTTMNDINNIL